MTLPNLIFDTSAVNKLAADVDREAITRTLGLLYVVGITETALSEIIATKNEADRAELLDVLKRLLACGECIMPFNWIIEEQAKAYRRDQIGYAWTPLNVRSRSAEEEIARPTFPHDLGEQTRAEMKQGDQRFRQVFRDAKPAFQNLFKVRQTRPSIREVVEKLMGDGGAYLEIGAGLFERAAGVRPTVEEVKDFIERCPPFKALLVALCFSQYDRCIRAENEQSPGKAGRNDMFSAVYLAYSGVFVTSDKGQYKAMKAVAELAGLDTTVSCYAEFRSGLIGLQ